MTTPAIAIPCLMGSAPGPSAPPAAAVVMTAVVVVTAVVVIIAVVVLTAVVVVVDELELNEIEPELAVPAPLPHPGISLRSVEQEITEELDEPAFCGNGLSTKLYRILWGWWLQL